MVTASTRQGEGDSWESEEAMKEHLRVGENR
jgi:hypothetical protein